jgi:uncharacterized protein YdiU (UPF0061 family)
MANDGSETEPNRIPFFIRKQLENPPLLPGESKREFNILFREIECSAEEGEKTAADYAMDYQATVLIWVVQRIDRMIAALIAHKRLQAVVALVRRTSLYGAAEPGSPAYHEDHGEALGFFTSEASKNKLMQRFASRGYGPEAVEVEAFEQALPLITTLNQQQNAARRQLLAFLKEIERRDARRAKELRKVADNVISRGRASASNKGTTS